MAARKKAKKTKAKRKTTTTRKKTSVRTKRTPVKRKTKAKKTTTKATKRNTTKRTTAKRATSKMSAVKTVKAGPIGKVSKAYTKGQLMTTLSERTGLTKKDVSNVIEQLGIVIEAHVKPGSAGQFSIPGLMKMKVKRTPAKKARKGVNPFTGEPCTFKAKPASRKVRILPLKNLKEMAL